MHNTQAVNNKDASGSMDSLVKNGVKNYEKLLKNNLEASAKFCDKIQTLESQIVRKMNDPALGNINGLNDAIIEFEKEFTEYKQAFNNVCNQTEKTVKEIKEWKTSLLSEIAANIDEIWDDDNKKFKKDTRWKYNPFSIFSSKPTEDDLKEQKAKLFRQRAIVEGCCAERFVDIEILGNKFDDVAEKIDILLIKLKQSLAEKQKQEEEKKKQEEKNKESSHLQQGNKNIQRKETKNKIDVIAPQEVDKIANWLITEQKAENFTTQDVINQCRDFGVNNFDDFKMSFLTGIELEKMQNFLKNDQNVSLSTEECAKLFQRYGVNTFAEFHNKLQQGMQEVAETIGGDGAHKICNKVYNEARNINDYVNAMNSLADNQNDPLIKKTDINLLQSKVDKMKETLKEKNIFIQILMLFGYDPDGLVTAYHMAKNRLKEAKMDERNNILFNSKNNIKNNNNTYSRPYFGNTTVANNNNIASFGPQNIQSVDNYIKY